MNSWITFALGSAVFASLTAIFAKIGVKDLNSNLATWFRTIVVFAVLTLILTYRREWSVPAQAPLKSWIFLAVSGVCTGLSWICYFRALQLGPVSRVAPVDKLSVAITIVLGALLLKEVITWQAAAGASLIVLGTIVLLL